jgi:hypothetical protein
VTALALPAPRAATGGPRWDRDRVRDWWSDCREILAGACPLIDVPSPVREVLEGL